MYGIYATFNLKLLAVFRNFAEYAQRNYRKALAQSRTDHFNLISFARGRSSNSKP